MAPSERPDSQPSSAANVIQQEIVAVQPDECGCVLITLSTPMAGICNERRATSESSHHEARAARSPSRNGQWTQIRVIGAGQSKIILSPSSAPIRRSARVE